MAQSNACPSSFAAAYLAVNRELGTPLFECAFVAVGLKFSSGIRREGHTPGWLLLPLWGNSPSAPPLQVLKKAFLTWIGESLGAPVVNESGTVGSAKPGAAVGPHRRQFLQPQGPVARWEFRPATQILRAESPWKFLRRGPVKWGPGVSRHGERSSPLRRPPAILWFLSHRWERNSPRRAELRKIGRRRNLHPQGKPFAFFLQLCYNNSKMPDYALIWRYPCPTFKF